MTNLEIRAAHRIGAALLKQSREKMHDLRNLRKETRTMKVTIEWSLGWFTQLWQLPYILKSQAHR